MNTSRKGSSSQASYTTGTISAGHVIDTKLTVDVARILATASARRCAFDNRPQPFALARITKQWSLIPIEEAQPIVVKAYHWYEARKPGKTLKIGGIDKHITSVDLLNASYASLQVADNPACVVLCAEARAIPPTDFEHRTGGETVFLYVDHKGEPRWMDASKAWYNSCTKRVYRHITFTGKPTPPDTMNLFRGFGVQARPGNCTLIKQHIREVICADDIPSYNAMLNLIAWQLQNIGTPSRIIVALITEEQQTGKGSLLEGVLNRIYGAAGHVAKQTSEVTSTFNESLRGKAFVFLDEALFRGDRRAADVIKGLAASRTLSINEKFLPRVSIPAGLNFWIASNDLTPAHVEEHDARYWALICSPHRRIAKHLPQATIDANVEYWNALHAEINNGGVEAFLYEMLNRDISAFLPQRDIPRNNAAHAALVRGSRDPGDPRNWLEECLGAGCFVYAETAATLTTPTEDLGKWLVWQEGVKVRAALLRESYTTWVSKQRGFGLKTVDPAVFWKILTDCGFAEARTNRGRLRVLPDPEACRLAIAGG